MNLLRKKFLIPVVATLFALLVPMTFSSATSHKPTLAQIEAAKKAELAKKKIADEALKKLARAKGNLKQLSIIADQAQRKYMACLLYTSPSPRDRQKSRMPSSA